jgi:peptide chain release factor 1
MPEIEDFDINIDPKDLRIDIYHASGAGGQNVNKVATAVRIVHEPTGIKVEMQEERNQQKNRDKAMKIINARVYDYFAQIEQDKNDEFRSRPSEQVTVLSGSVPTTSANRVTDHRIGLTLQKLDTILSGKLDEVIDALILFDQTQNLRP